MVSFSEAGQRLFSAYIICAIIIFAAVAVRLYSKRSVKAGFYTDDALMIFVVVARMITLGIQIWGLETGGGGVIADIMRGDGDTDAQMRNFLIALWANYIIYLATTLAIKLSLLIYFRRIFATRLYHWMSIGVGLFAISHFIGGLIGILVLCHPIDNWWNPQPNGACGDFGLYAVIINSMDVVIDAVILGMPIQGVLNTRLPKRTKMMLSSIFLLGIFAVVTAILRLTTMYHPQEDCPLIADTAFWTAVHVATAVVCACAPTYKPLCSRIASAAQVTPLWNRCSGYMRSRMSFIGLTGSLDTSRGGKGLSTPSSSSRDSSVVSKEHD